MSAQLGTTTLPEQALTWEETSPKFWTDHDGAIKRHYFSRRNGRLVSSGRKMARIWQFVKWEFLIAPVFLLTMIIMMTIMPLKWLQYKALLKERMGSSIKVFKRLLDVAGAISGLVLSSLVWFVLAILIKLDSKGGVIYKQSRIGRNRRKGERRVLQMEVPVERRKGDRRKDDLLGRPFKVYKFRSMKHDAEKKTGAIWATENDPRITHVGRVLRPYHLDEIPQFINVLKGDMSLVGPRPERPEFVTKLKGALPDYAQRFESKPGITGLAQITCGYDHSFEDVNKKLQYDLEYLSDPNPKTDLRILWQTLKKVSEWTTITAPGG